MRCIPLTYHWSQVRVKEDVTVVIHREGISVDSELKEVMNEYVDEEKEIIIT